HAAGAGARHLGRVERADPGKHVRHLSDVVVSGSSDTATARTSRGTAKLVYAFDHWLLLDLARTSIQRQIGSEKRLADALVELHVPTEEAATVADELWRHRPVDAAFETESLNESAARGFKSTWGFALTFVGVAALIVAIVVVLTLAR